MTAVTELHIPEPDRVTKPAYLNFSSEVQPAIYQPFVNLVNHLIQQGHDEVNILMATNGGAVAVGVALYTMLRALPIRVVTHNVGNVESIGNIIFLAGDDRFAAPNATFMFHGVSCGLTAATQLTVPLLKQVLTSLEADEARIASIVAERSAVTEPMVKGFFRQGETKDAQYALASGLISDIRHPVIPPGSPVHSL
jgi:ATP-dependent protease ClpP protease subunit